ncbi:hypothetical protein J6K35_01495, partial [bacterium]|nr:hypothetical protein [bacterium]
KIDIKPSGRYSVNKGGKTRYYAASGVELKENYFKQVETPDIVVTKNGKNISLNKTIQNRLNRLTTNLKKAEDENGFIGKGWSGFKNLTGIGDSSDKVRELQKAEQKLLSQFNANSKNKEKIFLQLTGQKYSQENLLKFLNGEIKLKSELALTGYKEGQKMAVDVTADVVSGVVSFGVYTAAVAAAPFTGGASIALGVAAAAGTGALVKTGLKYADAKSGGRKYTLKDAGHDVATGAFSGALAPVTAGAGGAVGKVVTVQAGKAGLKAGAAKAVAFTAEVSTDGAIGGGVDNAFRTAVDGGSAEEILDAGITGAKYGAVLGPVMGWAGKAVGKTYKVTKGVLKKADDVVPTPTAKPKATPEYELDEFGQVHLKNGAEPVKTEVEITGKLEDGQPIIKDADDNALAAKKKALKAQCLAKQQASSQVASDAAPTQNLTQPVSSKSLNIVSPTTSNVLNISSPLKIKSSNPVVNMRINKVSNAEIKAKLKEWNDNYGIDLLSIGGLIRTCEDDSALIGRIDRLFKMTKVDADGN